MLTLNIIPDTLKKEIEFRTVYRLTKNFLAWFIIALVIYSIIILAALYFLEQHLAETIVQANLITKNTGNYTNKVKNINNQLNAISNVQGEFVKWSSFLEKFSSSINDDIALSRLSLDRNQNTIYLSGTARTRDGLLALKDGMEKIGYFSDISFPIKNLLEKNDIAFEINAKIKIYEY
ncbi:MAG: hypothetical protein MUC28_01180 [Planctomycetes bacterium]|jgi:hypothetical protein|nr:hypothetical protein [Planctomycetota bacterium]